ncbi:hypothetical protein FRC08_012652 [Ceratobasidium sp. 394]|nr:hypothetical protein FRC08_012652 [Ceratobasidium sp. 394]
MDKAAVFTAMEADEALYKEFLASGLAKHANRTNIIWACLRQRQRVSQTAVPAAPLLGACPTPYVLETMTSVGGACSVMLPLHLVDLLTYPTGLRAAIQPAHLDAPVLSPYTHVANPWPLHSPVRLHHLCRGQMTIVPPPAPPAAPRHPAMTMQCLATHPPTPIVAIWLPPVVTTPQPSAVPPQRPVAVGLPPLIVTTRRIVINLLSPVATALLPLIALRILCLINTIIAPAPSSRA